MSIGLVIMNDWVTSIKRLSNLFGLLPRPRDGARNATILVSVSVSILHMSTETVWLFRRLWGCDRTC